MKDTVMISGAFNRSFRHKNVPMKAKCDTQIIPKNGNSFDYKNVKILFSIFCILILNLIFKINNYWSMFIFLNKNTISDIF